MVSEIPEAVFSTLEKNLEQNEAQYRQLINALPDLLYSYSLSQGGIFFSPSTFTILGYTPEYLLEHPFCWKESIHPDDQPVVYNAVRDFLLGKPFDLVYRIRHANGHRVWLRDRSISCSEQGDDFIIQGIASDITNQIRLVEDLHRAKELAEEANRLKNRFLATIGHELRTPLNSVLCMTQTLRFNNLTPEQQTVIELIEHSIGHLDELVVDITNLSKLEEGVLQLERNEFSLHKLLNDIHASQMPRLHAKNITLRTSITDDTPDLLTGDLLRIKLILQNLLTNAIACSKAGTVTIAVSSFQTDHQPPSVIFCVQDHRTPLSAEALGSIFEPFQDAGQAGKDATGLGLTISRKLAGMMGGTLWAEKAGDGSTRFNLQIPAVLHQHTGTDTP